MNRIFSIHQIRGRDLHILNLTEIIMSLNCCVIDFSSQKIGLFIFSLFQFSYCQKQRFLNIENILQRKYAFI